MTEADFFISHAGPDATFAEWMDQVVRRAGYSTIADMYDFKPGSNFVLEMSKALARAERMLLIWSSQAEGRFNVEQEWSNFIAVNHDKIVPVKLDTTQLPPLLRGVIAIDLAGVSKTEIATTMLVEGLRGRSRPAHALAFPRDTDQAAIETSVLLSKPSLDEVFRPRSEQESFASLISNASEAWLAAKGFEALLHHEEASIRRRLAAGAKFRFLLNNPGRRNLMSLMAKMSYGSRDRERVGSRLLEALARLVDLRRSFPEQVEIHSTDWLMPNGYTIIDPRDGGPMYVEYFGYRLSLGERLGVLAYRSTDPEFYKHHLGNYERQWRYSKDVGANDSPRN